MSFLFYIFSALALVGGIGVVVNRNPVSAAFSMVISFLGLAALFIQLDAYLVGTLQILVYAGAIMVLFLFIIMLLDVREEEKRRFPVINILGAGGVVVAFIGLLIVVLTRGGLGKVTLPALTTVEGPGTSDVHRIGELLFSHYWFPVQVVGVLLLVATVGVVVLSKKELK
ncbi:MAG: NADH-quinone oxidoreductase subunit J [Verrucomicrobiales bacterium]|nr:NADH-quinone oxidoreductase subunit J [Verrucomicrobiales bacterium]HQW29284.1 NADH-quinone oxidoreductase subunit J [Verrucomicrobiales bacterium]